MTDIDPAGIERIPLPAKSIPNPPPPSQGRKPNTDPLNFDIDTSRDGELYITCPICYDVIYAPLDTRTIRDVVDLASEHCTEHRGISDGQYTQR